MQAEAPFRGTRSRGRGADWKSFHCDVRPASRFRRWASACSFAAASPHCSARRSREGRAECLGAPVRAAARQAPQAAGRPEVSVLDVLSLGFVRRAAEHGLTTNPAFAGAYTFRPDADFAARFPDFLDGMPDGGLIMCHPGTVDAELARLDPLTALREREYAFLRERRISARARRARRDPGLIRLPGGKVSRQKIFARCVVSGGPPVAHMCARKCRSEEIIDDAAGT